MPTSPLILMWIKTHRCYVRMKDPYLIDASSSTYKSRYKKEISTQQYIQLNTREKVQQLNPDMPDQRHEIRPQSSRLQIALTWNRHRVGGPTRRPAIKEEIKVVNHDWVDHQACSLSQYIQVITCTAPSYYAPQRL